MIASERFPKFVTNSSEQSRTLGAQLDSTLAGKTPAEIMSNSEVFQKLVTELWHNLPCLTDESVLLCLPLYFNLNGPSSSYVADSPDSPEVWQLNQDYAERIWRMSFGNASSFRILQGLGKDERRMLTELCIKFEEETEKSFRQVLTLVGIT